MLFNKNKTPQSWNAFVIEDAENEENAQPNKKLIFNDQGRVFFLEDEQGRLQPIQGVDLLEHLGKGHLVFPNDEHKMAFTDALVQALQEEDKTRIRKKNVHKVLLATTIVVSSVAAVAGAVIGGVLLWKHTKHNQIIVPVRSNNILDWVAQHTKNIQLPANIKLPENIKLPNNITLPTNIALPKIELPFIHNK